MDELKHREDTDMKKKQERRICSLNECCHNTKRRTSPQGCVRSQDLMFTQIYTLLLTKPVHFARVHVGIWSIPLHVYIHKKHLSLVASCKSFLLENVLQCAWGYLLPTSSREISCW